MVADTKTTTETNAVLQSIRDSRGPQTKALLELIPSATAELMKQFMDHPDIQVRDRIRKGIRSLIEFVQIDTETPTPSTEQSAGGTGWQQIEPEVI